MSKHVALPLGWGCYGNGRQKRGNETAATLLKFDMVGSS